MDFNHIDIGKLDFTPRGRDSNGPVRFRRHCVGIDELPVDVGGERSVVLQKLKLLQREFTVPRRAEVDFGGR